MTISEKRCDEALELFRESPGGFTASERIGTAISHAIPSDIAAIEVFNSEGHHASRSWALPQPLIERHFPGFLKHRVHHPFFPEFIRTGLRQPVCISDYMGLRQLRSMGIYTDFFLPIGIQRQLGVALSAELAGVPVLVLGRSGADYSYTDRRILQTILHTTSTILDTEATAERHALLLMLLEDADEAVLLLSRELRLIHSTQRARDMLKRTFSKSRSGELPYALVETLRSCELGACKQINVRSDRSSSTLKVVVWASALGSQYALMLTEEMSPENTLAQNLSLTIREAEILALMMLGLTNVQIAERDKRSPHTIRTQVGAIFTKLSVPNRTAAVALAKDILRQH